MQDDVEHAERIAELLGREPIAYIGTNYAIQEQCLKSIRLGEFIGEGAEGAVYDACAPDCDNVVKVISLPVEFGNDFETEVRLTQIASDLKVGPQFVDAWQCGGYDKRVGKTDLGFIVTRKYDTSLAAFLAKTKGRLPMESVAQIDALIRQWHDNGFVHADLLPKNIVVNVRGKTITDAKLIDFGLSFSVASPPADALQRLAHNNARHKLKVVAQTAQEASAALAALDFQWLSRA